MDLTIGMLEYYLIGINALGFILYGINLFCYRFDATSQIDMAVTIASVLGGAPGIVLFILLFDRKSVKANMMSRVFVACMFVIQVMAYLFFKGRHGQRVTFMFWEFFGAHKILTTYLVAINVVTLTAFGIDKVNAILNKNRISILTLLGLSFIGGALGGLVAMYAFHHKTKKDYFMVGLPLIVIMQVVVVFCLMNL